MTSPLQESEVGRARWMPRDEIEARDLAHIGAYYKLIDGTEERIAIINAALEDCRAMKAHANRVEVAGWVDEYLDRWEAESCKPAASSSTTAQEEPK